MYLSKFQLLNYKSFQDSGILEFKPGINIIVGTNNSGKTALLEALSLNFQNHIHKTIQTVPFPSDVINSYSAYQLSLSVKKESIKLFIKKLSESGKRVLITLSDGHLRNASSQSLKDFLDDEELQDVEIKIRVRGSDPIPFDSMPNFFSSSYSTPIENSLNLKDVNEVYQRYDGFLDINELYFQQSGRFGETLQYQIFQKYRTTIYKFNAERSSSGISPTGNSYILKSDASNLAEVLLNLQGNRDHFELFNKYVSIVIPSIKWISVLPYEGITFQIKVWTLETIEKRVDLTYPLSDCGTGVSQVLSILYVIITSQEPQIIIIDEPQSFLHPGAAKKLIGIFKEFPQHQYFIATHSAEIIAAANPSTIVKLSYEKSETQVLTMSAKDIREQRSLLAELGVSLSDVFGADSILWVEGPTEELCFPLILFKLAPELLTGTKIISIKNTDDLVGGKTHFAEVMFDLYGRLSGENNLSPPVLGFVFDRENRTKQNRKDLEKRSPGRVHFIERCMYENYLLHPDAIAAVLNQYNLGQQHPFTRKAVQEELEINKVELKNKKNSFSKDTTPKQLLDPEYVDKNINAAKLLEVVFAKLSLGRLEFKKKTHSIMITEWLLENSPDHFVELVQLLRDILNGSKATMP